MDNVLSYIDQASFMGFRALGRGPVIEWTWVHSHPVHADAVHDFNHRLAQGLLGRLVQRSSLPGGRHRWVANRVAAPVTAASETIRVEQLPQWRSSLVDLAVDPEHGPGWRLVVQPLECGGTALSLLVSHTIADGLGVAQALCDAAAGVQPAHEYPPRSPRTSWRHIMRDAGVSARSLPDAWNAVALLSRRARDLAPGVSSSMARSAPSPSPSGATSRAADVPAVQIVLHERECASRASALGVSVNTLLAAFSARLGFRLGRVDGDGRVKLVIPVSDRTPGDLRANALRSVTVMVDPSECCANPRDLQRAIRAALASLRKHGDDSPILALTPYVPRFLVRNLEGMALGADFPVGLSNFGELDPAVNRPCGTDAVRMHVCLLERHTPSMLDRLGGKLFVVSYRLSGNICIDVSCWAPSVVASRDHLIAVVEHTLGDVTLTGTVSLRQAPPESEKRLAHPLPPV
jgi:diacylglycerol O-acyltransferase / wax synthase